jgi:hypothetical protein
MGALESLVFEAYLCGYLVLLLDDCRAIYDPLVRRH